MRTIQFLNLIKTYLNIIKWNSLLKIYWNFKIKLNLILVRKLYWIHIINKLLKIY